MKKSITGIAAALFVSTAHANLITFDMIEARWFNPVGGTVTAIDPAPPATGDVARIRWGGNAGDAGLVDSGYDLVARPTSFNEAAGDTFAFASFTHLNRVIPSGTAIDSVDLEIVADFSLDTGDSVFDFMGESFLFRFTHTETPNGLPDEFFPDADTLAVPGTGVNANGSADLVEITSLQETFVDPTTGLTLFLDGFSPSVEDAENGIFFERFLSGEGSLNNVVLAASFDVRSTDVPLPGSLALLGAGLLALRGVVAARKRA